MDLKGSNSRAENLNLTEAPKPIDKKAARNDRNPVAPASGTGTRSGRSPTNASQEKPVDIRRMK